MKKTYLLYFFLAVLACSCAEKKRLARSNEAAAQNNPTADSIKISKQQQ